MWAGIHPLILEQINSHRTTLIFVNSRRLAERLALALNQLAGAEIVHAHHGSLAVWERKGYGTRFEFTIPSFLQLPAHAPVHQNTCAR